MDCRAVRNAVYMYVYIDMSPFFIFVRDKVTKTPLLINDQVLIFCNTKHNVVHLSD